MLDSNIIYRSYLNRFSLSFKKKKDHNRFESETKFQTLVFIKFFIFLSIIMQILDLSLISSSMEIYMVFVILILLILVGCLLVFLANKYFIKKKVYLEIFLGLLIFTHSLVQIELQLPNLYLILFDDHEKINTENNDEIIAWVFLSLGIASEMIIMIAVINLRWIFSTILRFILYFLILLKFFKNVNSIGLFSINILVIFLYVIIPISVSYLNEKSYKEVYVSLKRNQENLICFEKLIEKNIPNLIFILKFDEPIVLYANSKSKEFFKTNSEENSILLEKLESIYLVSNEENSKANVINAYRTLTEEKSFLNFSDVEDYDFKSLDGIYFKPGGTETESDRPIVNFDIQIGVLQWKSEKAVLILLNDVSSKAKIQNLKEINNYKDMLLATVSHDLRTPLGAIIGFLEILMEKIIDKKYLKYVSAAFKSSKILLFMINDILDFSQISNKKIKLNYEDVFIKIALDGILDILKYQSKKKGLKLKVETPEFFDNMRVFCDPVRLQQILLNLIGNSIKFTFQGEIKLLISIDSCELHNYSHQKMIFNILDTGIGMQPENISKIFNLFYKVEHSNSNINRNGIGLGLFISQNLSRLMHDEGIQVRSEPNQGSQFSFSIPFNPNSDESLSYFEENTIINRVNMSSCENGNSQICGNPFSPSDKKLKVKVLLVDDDVMNILIHKKYLELYDIKYETALNGAKALEIIENNAGNNEFFSLILLDCNMPILNGFQTAERIQQLIENGIIPSVPIVALTANVTLSDIELCKKSGMEYFLAKPVSKRKFKEKLMELLKLNL